MASYPLSHTVKTPSVEDRAVIAEVLGLATTKMRYLEIASDAILRSGTYTGAHAVWDAPHDSARLTPKAVLDSWGRDPAPCLSLIVRHLAPQISSLRKSDFSHDRSLWSLLLPFPWNLLDAGGSLQGDSVVHSCEIEVFAGLGDDVVFRAQKILYRLESLIQAKDWAVVEFRGSRNVFVSIQNRRKQHVRVGTLVQVQGTEIETWTASGSFYLLDQAELAEFRALSAAPLEKASPPLLPGPFA